MATFLTSNPSILAVTIVAFALVCIGFVFEVGWRVYRKGKSSLSSSEQFDEVKRNSGFYYLNKETENRNNTELNTIKNDLQALKASVTKIAKILQAAHENKMQ